jgi:hypothetical protein
VAQTEVKSGRGVDSEREVGSEKNVESSRRQLEEQRNTPDLLTGQLLCGAMDIYPFCLESNACITRRCILMVDTTRALNNSSLNHIDKQQVDAFSLEDAHHQAVPFRRKHRGYRVRWPGSAICLVYKWYNAIQRRLAPLGWYDP